MITTKTGDRGMTDGPLGLRTDKDDAFCEMVGTLDELNAILGKAAFELFSVPITSSVIDIQERLLDIGAELYTGDPIISDGDVDYLDAVIQRYETPLKGFIIPSGGASGTLHTARAIARRAERRAVTLNKLQDVRPVVIQYLNRLSDALYVLALHVGPAVPRYWNVSETA